MKLVSLTLLACMLWMSGCAAVFKGTSETIRIKSVPPDAKVHINGGYVGKTPLKIKLSSKESHQIEFQKEGYLTRIHHLTNNVGVGWIFLDLFLGVIPIIVDAATGAWYYLDENPLEVPLEAK